MRFIVKKFFFKYSTEKTLRWLRYWKEQTRPLHIFSGLNSRLETEENVSEIEHRSTEIHQSEVDEKIVKKIKSITEL